MTQDVLDPSKAVTARKGGLRLWLEGCGAGVLLMLRYAWPHLSPLHTDLHHRMLPMNSVYGAVAIDLAVVCLVCVAVFWLLDRFDAEGMTLAWTVVAAGLFTQAWAFFVGQGYINVHLIKPVWLALVCMVIGVVLWFWRRAWYRGTVKMFRGGMALLGICIVWMLPQLIHMAAHSEPHDVRSFARPV
ncbi:MAG: hypothetical protein WBD10_04380, partial [Acidobacteriaceae bacterium]